MKTRAILAALLAACVLCSAPCWAADATCSQAKVFDEVDKNADGKITKDEFYYYIEATAFGLLDKDGNAKVEKVEWTAVEVGPDSVKVFTITDDNADGVIILEELMASPEKREVVDNLFSTLDKDGDEVLTKRELKKK